MYQTSARCRSALHANLLLLRCCMQVGCSTTNNCCNMLTANLGKVEISVGEWMMSSLNPCTMECADHLRCFLTPSYSVGREVLTVWGPGLDLGVQYKFLVQRNVPQHATVRITRIPHMTSGKGAGCKCDKGVSLLA